MTLTVGLPLLLPPKEADPANTASVGTVEAAVHDLQTLDAPVLARIVSAANQTLPTGTTDNLITFDTVDQDPYGMWDAARSERLTVPAFADGWYVATLTYSFAAAGSSGFEEQVAIVAHRTGQPAEYIAVETKPAPPTVTLGCFFTLPSPPRFLRAGDYVDAAAFQNSGGSLSTLTGQLATSLSLRRVGTVPPNLNTFNALTGAEANALNGIALNLLPGG